VSVVEGGRAPVGGRALLGQGAQDGEHGRRQGGVGVAVEDEVPRAERRHLPLAQRQRIVQQPLRLGRRPRQERQLPLDLYLPLPRSAVCQSPLTHTHTHTHQ
jgi:hypothetical protein